MGKFEKKGFSWKKLREAALEILAELVAAALFFAIGAGIMVILGNGDIAKMDPEGLILLGAVVVLAGFGILFAIIAAVRKKKKKEN